MITPSLRRRTTAATTALLLGLALTACGGDDSDSDDEPSSESSSQSSDSAATSDEPTSEEPTDETGSAPSEEELESALLSAADLPDGFTPEPDEDDTDEDDDTFEGTCLADIGEFSDALGFEPAVEVESNLTAAGETGQTFVGSQIEAYSDADAEAVAPAFADFTDTLGSCTTVQTTDDDGVTFDLAISYDDTVDLPEVDDQLRIQMTGTIAAGAESYDVVYRFVVALSGSFISLVGTYALGEDGTGVLDSIDDLAALQVGRVAELA